jgi:DNA-binding CsgD family transcriptional regulator
MFGPVFPGALFATVALLAGGKASVAENWINQCIQQAVGTGSSWGYGNSIASRTAIHFWQGHLQAAEADGRGFFDLDREAQMGVVVPIAAGYLAQTLSERGRTDEAWELLTTDTVRSFDDSIITSLVLDDARGQVLLRMGRPGQALVEAMGCASRAAAFDWDNGTLLQWRRSAALAHRALGEVDEASRLANEQLDLARNFGTHRGIGMALLTCALVEEAPPDAFEHSVEQLAASEDRLEHARALVEHGSALLRSDLAQAARRTLQEGLTLAARCGATVLSDRAHRELLAAGGRPRRIATTGAEALTPSEQRIAALAAKGSTNKEISQMLFVTPKTVESHMRSIFRKLAVSSRTQLAARLRVGDDEAVVSVNR